MYVKIFKRILDLFFSVFILILLSPLILIISVLIKAYDGGKVIFRQQRVGVNQKVYNFLKFRSMPENTENVPSTSVKEIKVTPIGKFIRRTNLDEIPQFINVLKGEMSVIGPRPSLPSQTDVIELRRSRGVYKLLPGLTGLAQVNSFDGMSAEQKVDYDEKYLNEISFLTDIIIVLKTFKYFLKKPPTY